jgi:uncharacterized membrane protein YqjE
MSGLRDAAQQVLADVIDIGRTRLELATVEIEEERVRLGQLLLGACVALFLLFAGVLLGAAWLVLWSPPDQRLMVLGALALGFLVAGAGAAWRWCQRAAAKPPMLHATLAELRRDAQDLKVAAT